MNIFSDSFLHTKDFESLRSEFSKAFHDSFSTIPYKFNPNYLYRGRNNWDNKKKIPIYLFENISELGAPPHLVDLKQGRCNRQGQSLFYCTQNSTAILFELDCQPGQIFTICVFKCRDNLMPLAIVGAKKISMIDSQHNTIFNSHYNKMTIQSKYLNDYVDSLFFNKSDKYYNATNAITSIFLHKTARVEFQRTAQLPINFNALIYSSVATALNSYNIVMDPNYSQKVLFPLELHRYNIIERPTLNQFKIAKTHSSNNIDSNGFIDWIQHDPVFIEYITDLSPI